MLNQEVAHYLPFVHGKFTIPWQLEKSVTVGLWAQILGKEELWDLAIVPKELEVSRNWH